MKEKPFIFFNGQTFYDFSDFSFPLNRAMLYGESIFTTILFSEKTPYYLLEHLSRTYKGIEFLYGKNFLTFELYKNVWQSLICAFESCRDGIDYSFRLTFFLKSSSRSFLSDDKGELCFFLLGSPIGISKRRIKGVSLALAQGRRVQDGKPSFLKMGNYGDTLIELRNAKKKGFDDILFLDFKNRVKECSTSNIILIRGTNLVTPQLDSCLLDGITRKNFIKFWKFMGGDVVERSIEFDEINSFDTVLLANSIQLIRTCFQLENIKFKKRKVINFSQTEIFQKFNSYSKENSYKEFIKYEKEKSWSRMPSVQEEV